MPHEPATTGAEGPAHRVFSVSSLRASQQEVREIRAGDKQNKTDSGLQDPNGTADAAEDLVAHWFHLKNVAAVLRQRRENVVLDANTFAPGLDQCVQLCLRRLHRDTVLEPSDKVQIVVSAI